MIITVYKCNLFVTFLLILGSKEVYYNSSMYL